MLFRSRNNAIRFFHARRLVRHLAARHAENETMAAEEAVNAAFVRPRRSGGGFATVADTEADSPQHAPKAQA